MLITLSPDSNWEFLTALSQAWNWTQERPRIYCDTGGELSWDDYLAQAKAENVKQLAVVGDVGMAALVTVKLVAEGVFEIHVTSPRGTKAAAILEALNSVRRGLFDDLGAAQICTSCPTYNGHEHKGSRRLAEACGMTPTGLEWEDETADGTRVVWREYAINRDTYYGRTEGDHRKSISVFSKAELARA